MLERTGTSYFDNNGTLEVELKSDSEIDQYHVDTSGVIRSAKSI